MKRPRYDLQSGSSIHDGRLVPGYGERKDLFYQDPHSQPAILLQLDSTNRSSGTISNPTWVLNTPIRGAYAASIRNVNIPNTWYNVTSDQKISCTYLSNPSSYPTSITISAGRYVYNPYVGELTYAEVSASDHTVFLNDLMYTIMRGFSGAVDSITIDASSGKWTWSWATNLDVVTSTSSFVTGTLNIISQDGITWNSGDLIDLTGPKMLNIDCPQLAASNIYNIPNQYSQSIFCSFPVGDTQYGDVVAYQPYIEHKIFYGQWDKSFTSVTISFKDPADNSAITLHANWTIEIMIYVDRLQ